MLDVFQAEGLVPGECEDSSRGSNNNVRTILLQDLFILLDGQATKEYCSLYCGHVLGETLVLFTDLEGQLSCVAHD